MMNPETRTTLARLVKALPDAAFALSADNRLICINAAARQLFSGMREGDPVSRNVRAPEILDAIAEARAAGLSLVTWLSRVPLERQFDTRVAALDPEIAGAVLVTLRDMTEVRRIERMRTDFVANASHELRTPLATLIGFVETLQGPARNDASARARFLGIMGEQARRMSRLIDDLLSLSRVEQNLHLRPSTTVDLTEIARHMRDALTPIAGEMGATIAIEAPTPVYVRGDRDELLRVAENLVENAIKYGGPGLVKVSVSQDGNAGTLCVEDRGPGIAPEHLPRLTERFYRIDDEASRSKGGTGLGLAIVKHIVARHQGRLLIWSEPMKGARFSVVLPHAECDQPIDPASL